MFEAALVYAVIGYLSPQSAMENCEPHASGGSRNEFSSRRWTFPGIEDDVFRYDPAGYRALNDANEVGAFRQLFPRERIDRSGRRRRTDQCKHR